MYKKFIFLVLTLFCVSLHAEIIETNNLDDIYQYMNEKEALFLLDIDDTLITNPVSLGSPPWRKWIKPKIVNYNSEFALYDALTLYLAKYFPYKTVESSTAQLVADLQQNGNTVFAFTARGRSEWHSTTLEGVDLFTHQQLIQVGIDFKETLVPNELQNLDSNYFYNGIIFASHIKKGELFKKLFQDLSYHPTYIIFVDDKLDQVKSVEAAVKEFGIPFIGFWYKRVDTDTSDFDPVVANVQLENLLLKNEILSDDQAKEVAQTTDNKDPANTLDQIFNQYDLRNLAPSLE